jgi:hypothetical protein
LLHLNSSDSNVLLNVSGMPEGQVFRRFGALETGLFGKNVAIKLIGYKLTFHVAHQISE